MTEKKNLFESPLFKISLSLFMAFVMFFSVPMNTCAAQLDLIFYNNTAYVPLNAAVYNSHSLNAVVPVSYQGHHSLFMAFYNKTSYSYFSGSVVLPVTIVFTPSITDQSLFTSRGCDFSVSVASSQEGIYVVPMVKSRTANSIVFDLYVNFDHVKISPDPSIWLNLDFDLSFMGLINQIAYNSVSCRAIANFTYGTYSTTGNFYTVPWDGDPFMHRVVSSFDSLISGQSTINSTIISWCTNIINKLQSQINNDNSNTNRIVNNLNTNSSNEIDNANKNSQNQINAANKNSQNEIDTANKNADDIMHSYDSGSQDSDNQRFDESQKELQQTEDTLFGSASGYFEAIKFDDYLSTLNVIASSLSFVSGLMQTIYTKSAVFGVIVTISLVVMIASKVIGLYRFSTGGDKGG